MEAVTIGQYRVTGVIGRGGMGVVYAAEHALLGRPAAIKVLLPALSQQQDIVTRFFNEARAATAIRHPGIVEIYDFGWTPDGAAYLVMEHLEGETLSRRLGRGLFRWHAALAVVRQIAGALGAAHAKGIVHRDLKPENIFLVSDPEVPGGERIKLLDFGIAKLAGETSAAVHVTRTGAVIGTPTYMAPEQCRGVPIDHRADLYAVGCILFELCTGRPPFVGEGTGDVLAAHIHIPPATLAASRVEVPALVERLLQRLLAKAPGQRVQTSDELIREIDAVTADVRAAATRASTSRSGRAAAVVAAPSVTTLSGAATTSERLPAVTVRGRARRVAVVSTAAAAITVMVVVLVMRRGDDTTTIGAPPAVSHSASSVVQEAAPVRTPAAAGDAPSPQPVAAESAPPPPPPTQPPQPQSEPPSLPVPPPASPPPREAPPRPTIDVLVDSAPPGAQVVLGGAVLGKTPYRGTLPRRTGELVFVLQLSGYANKTVAVRADQAVSERIRLIKTTPERSRVPDRDQSVNPFAE
jgi:serine/threonine-protein kinase